MHKLESVSAVSGCLNKPAFIASPSRIPASECCSETSKNFPCFLDGYRIDPYTGICRYPKKPGKKSGFSAEIKCLKYLSQYAGAPYRRRQNHSTAGRLHCLQQCRTRDKYHNQRPCSASTAPRSLNNQMLPHHRLSGCRIPDTQRNCLFRYPRFDPRMCHSIFRYRLKPSRKMTPPYENGQ